VRYIDLILGLGLACASVLSARAALADIPPPGLCAGQKPGDTCDEAVNTSGELVGAGICVDEKCRRATPDGTVTYDCVMCRPASPAPGAGGSPSPSEGDAGGPPAPSETRDDGKAAGCSVVVGSDERGLAAALASALGLLGLLQRRRERRT
jgi:MYXO-CTERM domain-containing protein